MLKRIREQFGTAGLIVAIVAMVVAVAGTAYAATKLNATQKKETEKIAKKLAGKDGVPGAPGAKGDSGPKGEQGSQGIQGKKGDNGDPGKSIALLNEAPFNCPAGGYTYEIEGSAEEDEICNGAMGDKGDKGDKGDPGEPWTVGGSLPEGATLTGVYAINANSIEESSNIVPNKIYGPISFSLPLVTGLSGSAVHFIELATTECPGTTAIPKALPGNLCLYKSTSSSGGLSYENVFKLSTTGAGTQRSGGNLGFSVTQPGPRTALGSWAVTAWKTPVVTAVSPNHGAAAGGTSVTISGQNFTGATQVKFGGVIQGSAFTVNSAGTEITNLTSPPGSGVVDVTVVNPAGTSATGAADKYTYE